MDDDHSTDDMVDSLLIRLDQLPESHFPGEGGFDECKDVLIGFFHNFGLDLPNETGFKIHEKRVRKRGKMGDRRPKRGDRRLKRGDRSRTNFSKVSNFGKVLNEIPIIRKTKESTPGIRSALAKKIRQGEPTYISRM